MNKSDLIKAMGADLGSEKDAALALESLISALTEGLKAGENITLPGLGGFKVVRRSARTGRNPKTGEVLEIPAGTTCKFSAGKKLKEAIN